MDLAAYLRRIGCDRPGGPTLATLAALQLAHTGSIPFENLDIHLGRPIRLDLAALEAKLVQGRRGGYCFEHNSLFAAALTALGFQVRLREARVRRSPTTLARTHLTLEVALEGRPWLVDVGFGAECILGPVPLDGAEQARFGTAHRVVAEGSRQVLQVLEGGAWTDLYALEPSEVFPIDLVVANHYTSTHPDSRFVQVLTAQRAAPGERVILRNLTLTEVRQGVETQRDLARGDLLEVLRERFGLALPPGTRFRALDDPGPPA